MYDTYISEYVLFEINKTVENEKKERLTANESVFAMAGYSVFRHAGTEVEFCFIVEDNICCLIINVKPEL